MNATRQIDDYTFHFPDPNLCASFEPVLEDLVTSPQELDGYEPVQRRKGQPVRVFRFRIGDKRYVAKWSRSHSTLDRARNLLRPPKGRLAWENAMRLHALGFDTPKVVAYAERRLLGLVRRSFLVTEEIAGAQKLHQFLHQSCAAPEARAMRREMMDQIGALLARLHKGGIYHSDLRSANILVQQQSAGPKLFLVDTEAVRFCGEVSEERRLKNFCILNFTFVNGLTLTDRLRVFRSYADTCKLDRCDRKALLRRAITACEKSMHEKVSKPQLRPYRIPSGLPYREQIKVITEALQVRIRQKSGASAADLLEETH